MIFLWFHYVGKKTGNFQIWFFYDFFMVEFMIFYDEIYDLVSLGFEEKSRKNTKKNNHKKIIKKS